MSFPVSFDEFFRGLWGFDPFPWQVNFAARMVAGEVPDFVSVPTGSGKTACVDAAVYALAAQAALPAEERTQGRRIFFIVNRRVIVDEVYQRAGDICKSCALPRRRPRSDESRQRCAVLRAMRARFR